MKALTGAFMRFLLVVAGCALGFYMGWNWGLLGVVGAIPVALGVGLLAGVVVGMHTEER